MRKPQVVQERVNASRLLLVAEPDFTGDEVEVLRDQLARRIGKTMEIEVQFVDSIPRSENRKPRAVISRISPPSGASNGAS